MLYIALLHYPVYNKEGRVVTTAIANMDIHDIARISRTYGAAGFYIVNPVPEQRNLAREIIDHWRQGYGATFNKFRQSAFELIRIKETLRDVVTDISTETGSIPKTIVTGANFSGDLLKFADFKEILKNKDATFLILFGTGSGIASEIVNSADYRLESVRSPVNYNHLAVRSAVAIVMDRLLGV